MKRFEGKTVVVTGSGSGIGEATAKRFHEEGARVVLNGRTREKLERVAKTLGDERVRIVQGDVANRDDAERLVKESMDFGGLDVLVNNAGIGVMGSMEDVEPEDFDSVIRINLTGTYNCTRAAWSALKERRGCVVNVSSVSGIGGDWGAFAYNASKGGVTNMTRALALDFDGSGVRVNAVAPSFTKTEMGAGIQENEELLEAMRTRIPIGRGAEPEEVASAIAFLASEDARFVNGVILPVDGGLSASNGQPKLG